MENQKYTSCEFKILLLNICFFKFENNIHDLYEKDNQINLLNFGQKIFTFFFFCFFLVKKF